MTTQHIDGGVTSPRPSTCTSSLDPQPQIALIVADHGTTTEQQRTRMVNVDICSGSQSQRRGNLALNLETKCFDQRTQVKATAGQQLTNVFIDAPVDTIYDVVRQHYLGAEVLVTPQVRANRLEHRYFWLEPPNLTSLDQRAEDVLRGQGAGKREGGKVSCKNAILRLRVPRGKHHGIISRPALQDGSVCRRWPMVYVRPPTPRLWSPQCGVDPTPP